MIKLKDLITEGKLTEAKVNYNFSENELKRVLQLLGRNASTEIKMIKAFEKAFGRKLTRDELFESINEAGVNVWYFYKKSNKDKNKFFKMLSDFRKKHSDTKWIKMLNYALEDFNENPKKYKTIDDKQNILFKNLQNNKKVYEGKLTEGVDYIVTIEDRKGKLIQKGNFTLKADANLYIKDMMKKHKLKREKGFWGNTKTGVEMSTNF